MCGRRSQRRTRAPAGSNEHSLCIGALLKATLDLAETVNQPPPTRSRSREPGSKIAESNPTTAEPISKLVESSPSFAGVLLNPTKSAHFRSRSAQTTSKSTRP